MRFARRIRIVVLSPYNYQLTASLRGRDARAPARDTRSFEIFSRKIFSPGQDLNELYKFVDCRD